MDNKYHELDKQISQEVLSECRYYDKFGYCTICNCPDCGAVKCKGICSLYKYAEDLGE